ncbi:hypothetical protein ACOJA0_03465 [Corynebacterium amycolatum]|uniref:hypothetical protein n=1 Tax=Corynebacterium amycolatum TaxID=43765 RepID=UPI003B58C4C6
MSNEARARKPFIGRAMPQKTVPISKLDMDLQNPRLFSDATDQTDAMRQMLETTGEKCMQLLRDITRVGQLSSADLPIVMPVDNRFVMLEGNRRLLCLRLWKRPKLLDSLGSVGTQYKRRVDKYIRESDFNAPPSIRVVVASNRKEADTWINRRHGLNSDGTGTVEWGAYQKARREAQQNPSKASRGYAFVSFVTRDFADDVQLQAALHKLVEKNFTILDRVFGDGDFRSIFGIDFRGLEVDLEKGKEATFPAIRQLVLELSIMKKGSRKLDEAAQRKEFAERIAKHLSDSNEPGYTSAPSNSASSRSIGSPTAKKDSLDEPPSKESSSPPKTEKPKIKRRNRREAVKVLQGLSLNSFPERLDLLANEVAQLDLAKFPELGAATLRVLLDLSLTHFLSVFPNAETNDKSVWGKTRAVIEFLDPECASYANKVQSWPEMKELYNRCNEESMKVIQLGVHSSQMPNTTSEAKIWFDRIEPLLVAMNEKLRNNTDS